jgi:hypothetical protein
VSRSVGGTQRDQYLLGGTQHVVMILIFLIIFFQKANSHELCIHRYAAVNLLRFLAGECFLGDKITSAALASEIMVQMAQFVLTGQEFFVQQMHNPLTTWQSRLMMGAVGACTFIFHRHQKLMLCSDPSIRICKICASILCNGSRMCNLDDPWSIMHVAVTPTPVLLTNCEIESHDYRSALHMRSF